ncbi:hypothetical protein [Paraburkholderia youngii]|uniref:hypothetical protein n=1 Tax=Paraburkholderia youngii TaxID=2782701 RepID=UPI003D206CE2
MRNIKGFRLRKDATDEQDVGAVPGKGAGAGFLSGAVFGFSLMLLLVGLGSNEKVTMIGAVVAAGLSLLAFRAIPFDRAQNAGKKSGDNQREA